MKTEKVLDDDLAYEILSVVEEMWLPMVRLPV